MSCKFCLCPGHTLRTCTSAGCATLVTTVIEMISIEPYNIKYQIDLLKTFSTVQIAVICKSFHQPFSRPKNAMICDIIDILFGSRGRTSRNLINNLSPEITAIIDTSYDVIWSWAPPIKDIDLKNSIMQTLDIYYMMRYNLRRFGYPIHNFYEAVLYVMQEQQQMMKPHLARLNINVTVLPGLQVEECVICAEDRPAAKLGCGHCYCANCIFKTAETRTKSVILCALCRADITTVQVFNHTIRYTLSNEFKKV